MKVFKLIVTQTDNCIEICQYVLKNIDKIMQMGVRIQIEKINRDEFDEELVATLRKRGISRLPALIIPGNGDNTVIIGTGRICAIFEKNIRVITNESRVAVSDNLEDYFTHEAFKQEGNKMVPRDDEDEDEGEHNARDIQERMMQLSARRGMTQGKDGSAEKRPPVADTPQPTQDYDEENFRDNIQPIHTDDKMDQIMMNAWLQNLE